MKFNDLQERLRILLCARVRAGELTGSSLARTIGVRQSHISNFLRNKRSLSLGAMDDVLGVLRMSVLDLAEPQEINQRVTLMDPPEHGAFENVVMVRPEVAARQVVITSENVVTFVKFRKNFLRQLRSERVRRPENWRRFVLVKVDEFSGTGMYPRLEAGATVLIDRHYNSLRPYRMGHRNLYAVLYQETAVMRHIEVRQGRLVLHALNPAFGSESMDPAPGKAVEDLLVGRVAWVGKET